MRRPSIAALTASTTGVLLAFAILTLWVRESWALAAFQTGILATAIVWILYAAWSGRSVIWHPLLAPLAGVVVIGAAQLALHRTAYAWETLGGVLNWTTHLAVAFLLLQCTVDHAIRERWLTAFALFGIMVAVIATLQLFTSDGKVFWLFDSGYKDLVLGPFVYHNRYAQFVELLMPLVLYRAVVTPRFAPFWMLGAAILFASVIAAVSRAGFVILALEIVAVLIWARRHRLLPRKMFLAFAAQIVGGAAVWGMVVGWTGLSERFGLNPFEDMRVAFYHSSLDMIRDHPIVGTGLSTWPTVYPQYALFDPGLFVNAAHCDWLQWTAEGGVMLLLLMIAAALFVARPLARSIQGLGVVAVLAHGLIDYPMQHAAFASLVFAMGGIVAAEQVSRRQSASETLQLTAAKRARLHPAP